VNVAIVGAGIAGLTCAHLLQPEHEITVFEADDCPGGHTRTVDVETERGLYRVDTGFVVFNDCNYPGFERLLERLGVASQPSTMSFSVSDGRGDFEYNGASPNGLFARRSSLVRPSFHRMVRDLLRFNREAPALIGLNGSGPTLIDYLEEGGYSPEFVERLIVPQASAVWSTDPRDLRRFPASLLAEFFDNHGMFGFTGRPNWRAVSGGSSRYVDRLTAPMRDRLRLSSPVVRMERFADRVEVSAAGGGRVGAPEAFDEVIVRRTPTRRWRCWPIPAAPRSRCSARSPSSRTRSCSTPTTRCSRAATARGRAGTSTSRTSPPSAPP
jgi:predicted NAD/FAD-binding protein